MQKESPMNNENMNREIEEAIAAGERALASLRVAGEKLNSARKWGIFDMLGGGFIASAVKRSRMDDASAYMEDAKCNMQIFQRELRDVSLATDLNLETGGFLSFADYVFDGFIADYMVQTKIDDARTQVENAIGEVERILMNLRNQRGRG